MDWRDALSGAAQKRPDATAFRFHTDTPGEAAGVSYGDLDQRARAVAAHLVEKGLSGRTALLLFPAGLDYVVTFFGCLYAGVVAVPAYPPSRHPRSVARLVALVRDSGADTALTTSVLRDRLGPWLASHEHLPPLRLVATDEFGPENSPTWRAPALAPDDIAFLQYTSGSTSTPRGVVLSHENLLANTAMIGRVFRLDEEMRGVSWLPMYHDMGLIGSVLATVRAGGSMSLMAPSTFARDPLRWLTVVSEERATVTGGPNFAYDLAVDRVPEAERAPLDLSSWRVAYNGAEPIRRRTLERFTEAFAPSGFRSSAFLPCYGLAESSLLVAGGPAHGGYVTTPPPEGSGAASPELVGSGALLPEQRLEIVDPDTRQVTPAGAIGEIWVAGPSVARGYFHRADAVADTFGARLDRADDDTDFLRTGDLGFVRDGQLYVTGRRKDLVIVRGRNHYPQDIELTAEEGSPALRSNGGAAFSVRRGDGEEQLVVVHELIHGHDVDDPDALARDVQTLVAERHEVRPHAVVLIRTSSLPRTSSGKVARHACRAAYLDGELLVVGECSTPDATPDGATATGTGTTDTARDTGETRDVASFLRAATAELLRVSPEQVPLDRPLAALGLDSIDTVRLQHRVQSTLHVELTLEDALTATIEQLVDLVGDRPHTAGGPDRPRAARSDAPGDFALSPGQRAMWFLHQIDPDTTAYHLGGAAEFTGDLDAEALRRALRALTDRHPALRTTFPAVGDGPVQRVHAELPPDLTEFEVTDWSAQRLRDALTEATYRTFDLAEGPLLRLTLFHGGTDGTHHLVLAVHHLVADLWSMEILLRELDQFYRCYRNGEALPELPATIGLTGAAPRLADRVTGTAGDELWTFWQRELAGAPTVLELPTAQGRPPRQRLRAGQRRFRVDGRVSARLAELARQRDTTLYTVLLSAYQVLLARYTGQRDLLVGSPAHGRPYAELADSVGSFINTAVLRGRVDPQEPFTTLLDRAARSVPQALRHADLPLSDLVEKLRVPRDTSRAPLVQTLFTLQPSAGPRGEALAGFALGDDRVRLPLGDVTLRPVPLEQPHGQLDLQLTFAEINGDLSGLLQFDSDLFTPDTADRMVGHLRVLLGAIAENPEAPTGLLPLLTASERRSTLLHGNDTARDYRAGTPVHALFAEQAARTPDAPALSFDDVEYASGRSPDAARVRAVPTRTYRQLDEEVSRLARLLLRRGLLPEQIVGVRLPHTDDTVLAMLAVLRAGGTYLPVDPHLPAERQRFLLADSGASLLLTTEALAREHGGPAPVEQLCLDGLGPLLAAEPATDPQVTVRADHRAYVLYTSGSTGRPKGVQIPHGSLVNFLTSMADSLRPAEGDRLLAVTTFSFDISALEVYLPLVTGGTAHIVPRSVAASGDQLRYRLDSGAFAMTQATPATWRLLLDCGWRGHPATTMLSGGEALSPGLAQRLLALDSGPLWDLYGPTETTIWSTAARVENVPGTATRLGAPLANTRIHVLDEHLEPVPAGVSGEVMIGGDGLARGYLGRPGLTATAFVPDPHGNRPGARLYRTGDLARVTPDGDIELLGRVDHQVKVNGHRVELGEIDAALSTVPALRQGVATVHRHATTGTASLVAHVQARHRTGVGAFDEQGATRALREELAGKLPGYMVPTRFVWVDTFPLNTSGKVDRGALRAPETLPSGPRQRPATATEGELAVIIGELLGTADIGRTDNLFDHGAHSLLMSRFAARVRESFGVQLPLRTVFENPTLEHLAAAVDDRASAETDTADTRSRRIERVDRDGPRATLSSPGGRDPLRALRAARELSRRNGS
ncbi:amino acid adenylation domain-containing protein [Streptomyces sp. NPDC005438]|uniref:amino acid adenylation domain-containing protein n=1 Tax=Streptomyces sp. NPDC005438 TaxID=3156880 RepID=UPI00339F90CB